MTEQSEVDDLWQAIDIGLDDLSDNEQNLDSPAKNSSVACKSDNLPTSSKYTPTQFKNLNKHKYYENPLSLNNKRMKTETGPEEKRNFNQKSSNDLGDAGLEIEKLFNEDSSVQTSTKLISFFLKNKEVNIPVLLKYIILQNRSYQVKTWKHVTTKGASGNWELEFQIPEDILSILKTANWKLYYGLTCLSVHCGSGTINEVPKKTDKGTETISFCLKDQEEIHICELRKYLTFQNRSYQINRWQHVATKCKPGNSEFEFEIPGSDLLVIQNANWRLYYGLRCLRIHHVSST